MIAASEPQEFVPHGRGHCELHPGPVQQHTSKYHHHLTNRGDPDIPIFAFKDVAIKDTGKKELWHLRAEDGDSADFDEEMYISGHTVVWSKGCHGSCKVVHKSFTVSAPVTEAFWCTFNAASGKPDLLQEGKEQTVELVESVCVVQGTALSVFTSKGEEHVVTLPFQVANAWMVEHGILFERSSGESELTNEYKKSSEILPSLFSLLHPLDEPAPVICKYGGSISRVNYVTDQSQHIVFTSIKPPLVMTYDDMLGSHSVWTIRKATLEEGYNASGLSGLAGYTSQTPNTTQFPSSSSGLLPGFMISSSHSNLSLSCQSPNRSSPYRSQHSSRVASPAARMLSPAITHMAALSRSQSPSFHHSSSSGICMSPGMRSPAISRSPVVSFSTSVINDSCVDVVEPLAPEICLDHIWTEHSPTQCEGPQYKASKAFLTSDMCGQKFLCYLVELCRELRCVKYSETNDRKQLIFGTTTVIQAKDVLSLDKLNMMLTIDINGSLVLYSGIVKVSKVHLPYTPSSLSLTMSGSLPRPSTPLDSPRFPTTSSRPSSAMGAVMEEVVMLSPVQAEFSDSSKLQDTGPSYLDDYAFSSCGQIVALRDPVSTRFTLEYGNGNMYRTSLPEMCSSPLVKYCLEALKYILPKDVAIQLMVRWYATNNAPGGPTSRSEWQKFMVCLLSMMGYDVARLHQANQFDPDGSLSPIAPKKHKMSGSSEDWEYLFDSDYHKKEGHSQARLLHLTNPDISSEDGMKHEQGSVDTTAVLFTYIPTILFTLHLVYEEFKLNVMLSRNSQDLAALLVQIASDLQMAEYIDLYCRDHPTLVAGLKEEYKQMLPEHHQLLQQASYLSTAPPSVYQYLCKLIKGMAVGTYPYLENINQYSRNIILLYVTFLTPTTATSMQEMEDKFIQRIPPSGPRQFTKEMKKKELTFAKDCSAAERVVLCMTNMGLTLQDLECLPFGVSLALHDAIYHCRSNPPADWPETAYMLIGRQDLSAEARLLDKKDHLPPAEEDNGDEEDDGMECLDLELLKLRFPDDLRVQEVRRLLQSSKPVRIALVQKPEVSDHDFIEEQENRLLSICQRTMSLPVGRGMFTLCTSRPVITETLTIPKLNLTGRAPPRNNTVDLKHIDVPANMSAWPSFHNGVAAGLRIAPGDSQIDAKWIVYNKPKTGLGNELTNEHAGFLMALGLNGHLAKLDTLNLHEYLIKTHEFTSVGLLLGLAAVKRGTMDVSTTKTLSIHAEALLPVSSSDLDVPHIVQVAAIIGIGLVYQGTAHRHIAEVLLAEIGRPPGPEMENCTDRESYSLAAGISLGLVTLGHGSDAIGLSDLNIADQLYHYMVGGQRRPMTAAQREKFKSPSYQIKEGDQVNTDLTSPGATLALGLMFLKTGNRAVAQWLTAPDTQFLLDFVRPDFLILRILSHGLILWDEIRPTIEWVKSNIPKIVHDYAFKKTSAEDGGNDTDIDYQTMSQAYCNILAGACMCVGLRFAGAANESAFNCLLHFAKHFISLSTKTDAEIAGKNTIESCLNATVLSLAMVMAGTGNLEVLRLTRHLHTRIGNEVHYGSHMATHMAIGLLFLGGGRYTLSTSNTAIAALVCSLFPRFPMHSNDNRYHLQALRHLYVLAAEPRLILPRDVDTNKLCYARLEVIFKETAWYKELKVEMMAPCIIPELGLLKEISVLGPRYWHIKLDAVKYRDTVKAILNNSGTLYVKQRAGHLSYVEDPKGFRSLLSQTFTHDQSGHQTVQPDVIRSFTSDPSILVFAEYCCNQNLSSKEEREMISLFCSVLYECITKEKPEILETHIAMDQAVQTTLTSPNAYSLWQIKLILAYYEEAYPRLRKTLPTMFMWPLINSEFLTSVKSRIDNHLDSWFQGNVASVADYLKMRNTSRILDHLLYSFLLFHDIPSPCQLSKMLRTLGCQSVPQLIKVLTDLHLPVSSAMRLLPALQQ
ncbi:anaphase-promoting complex subunit 1-like [Ptychodera flava]|uniref:anaphase-promoting complex subunit 1-like n=1 Tax=Ptychodera flava TaxID=63121 RepID=UPI00396A2956